MDFSKLTTGDKVVGAGTVLFLIAMFLPWYGLDFGDLGSASNSGWDYFLSGLLPLLIALAMVAQIYIERFTTTQLPALPLPWRQVHLIAGAVVAALVLLRVVIGADEEGGGFSVELDRMWGLWVALIAAVAIGVGGFLKSKEPEGVSAGHSAPPQPF